MKKTTEESVATWPPVGYERKKRKFLYFNGESQVPKIDAMYRAEFPEWDKKFRRVMLVGESKPLGNGVWMLRVKDVRC